MTAPDVAAEAAELREIITGLRAEAAGLAAPLRTIANKATAVESVVDVMLAARRAGYREGVAAHDDGAAAARAQRARAGFQVVPDGSPQPGGAA